MRVATQFSSALLARLLEWQLRRMELNRSTRPRLLALRRRQGGRFNSALAQGIVGNLQDIRLRRTVRWAAARSPFYRAKFSAMSLQPGIIRGRQDIRLLPLTGPEDIQDPDRFLCVPRDEIGRIYATSGTSRAPKRIYRSERDFERMVNLCAVLLRNQPYKQRLTGMIAHAQGLFGLAESAEAAVRRAGGLALPIGQPLPEEALEQILRYRPNWFMTSPSYMVALTRHAERVGAQSPLQTVVLDGEILTAEQTELITAYWTAEVINGYGLTEVGTVAFGRPGCDALHLNGLNVLVEIIDPESGEAADDGELLVTSLNQEAMPLLRYRTGDHVCRTACRCGRNWPAIHVFGRYGDSVVVAATNVHGPLVAEDIAKLDGTTGSLELLVDHVEGIDRMTLRVGLCSGHSLNANTVTKRLFALYPALEDDLRAEAFALQVQFVENFWLRPKPLRVRDQRGTAPGGGRQCSANSGAVAQRD